MNYVVKKRSMEAYKSQATRLHAQNAIMNKFRIGKVDTSVTKTITELISELPEINHRTVRRAVHDLVSMGHLFAVGRRSNAILYGTEQAAKQTSSEIMYVLNGEQVNLPTLVLKLFSVDDNIFGRHLDRETQTYIRRAVGLGIMSSGTPELAEAMFKAKANVTEIKEELKRLYNLAKELESSQIFQFNQREMVFEDLKLMMKKYPHYVQFLRDVAS